MAILPMVWVPADTIPAWSGYGNNFIPMGSTRTLPVESWIGHVDSPVLESRPWRLEP